MQYTGWILLVITWLFSVYSYITLPEIIPIHFNMEGKADNYGNKITLWILPLISTLVFLLLTMLIRWPHIFNYPVIITEKNAALHYTNATRLIRWLKACIQLCILIIIIFVHLAVTGKTDGPGTWLLLVILTTIILPTIYFVIRSFNLEKK